MSFLLLISGLKRSRKMIKYNNHEGLNKRMPNYQVRLGLGMHLGYSIEGAIGSFYKIDPTYLSPNVKMAETLEGATKVFNVPLLISDTLFVCLSRRIKDYCRPVDWALFSGKTEPLKLYTIDVKPDNIPLEDESEYLASLYMNVREKKIKRVRERMKRNKIRENAFSGDCEVSKLFMVDKDIQLMTKPFSQQFREQYRKAYNLYIKGDWPEAKVQFEATKKLVKEAPDPLSDNHLKTMAEYNFKAPKDWQGWREIDA